MVSPDDMASAYCQSGNDLHKASEMLYNMLGSSSNNGGCGYDTRESTNAYQDLSVKFEENLQFNDSSQRSNLEKEVKSNIFTVSERSEPRTVHQPRTKKYGLVTEPLEDRVIEFKTPFVKKEVNEGNEEVEDNYDTLREAVMEHWTTMNYTIKLDTSIWLRLERQTKHLPKYSLKPAIHYLKLMVGANDDKNKPNARKRLISKLLQRDAITWTEEQDGQVGLEIGINLLDFTVDKL
ncbi:hypothetical protein L1987_49553 [Smallanthus sonchifolius]|uniref:Uncharacterized protein n=1 Tax=Smallanthus sonchifolius TaxID=185202 RepID=A0ACB9FW30_9ASTR|nr:hypothetical protein L1987_49553 [Smallanthus sonchifolius]